MKHSDGSIINSYFSVSTPPNSNSVYHEGSQLMLGQVEKTHFVDDSTNISKKYVEYDVSVRDSKGGQSTYKNLQCAFSMYGTNDFQEKVLEYNDIAFQDKLDTSSFFKHKNGSLVIIAFLNNNIDKPFILAALQHPRLEHGAKKSDGIRLRGEFRGLQYGIDQYGALSVIYKGDRSPDGKFKRPSTAPTSISISKDGIFSIEDKENQKFSINRVAKTITLEQYAEVKADEVGGDPAKPQNYNPGAASTIVNSIKMDKASKIITIQAGSTVIIVDGTSDSILLNTKSGTSLLIDGNGDVVEVTCDTAKIGKNASFHATLAENVISYNDAHIHLAPQKESGILPTQAPLIPMGAYAGTVLDPTALKILLRGNQ